MEEKNKFSVSFKNNLEEQELKKWFLEQAKIIGPGNYIKQLLYKEKIKEEKVKEGY